MTMNQITAGAGADTAVNENFRAVGPASLYGIKTIAGLNLTLYGAPFNGVSVADQTVALTASNTNYVVAHRTTGTVTAATSTTNWNDQTTYMRLYQIVAGASTMTIASDSDKRQAYGDRPGLLINPMTTAEDLIKGGASGSPVRVGVGANGQVLGVAAGAVGWINNPAGFTNPMTTAGDLIAGGAAGAAGRLGIGNEGEVLTVVSGAPVWSPPKVLQNSQSAAYTLVAADAGKHIYHPAADTTARIWTIPANASVAFPIGTVVTFDNDFGAGTITIAITTDTLVLVGTAGSTGSRTLASGGQATAIKVTATRWRISGSGLT